MPYLEMEINNLGQDGLNSLMNLLGFGEEEEQMADVIFLSINFNNSDNIIDSFKEDSDAECGISTIDARDIVSPSQEQRRDIKRFINSRTLVTGSNSCFDKAKKFCFGVPEWVTAEDFERGIRDAFEIRDEVKGGFRKIVVVHDSEKELEVLRALGVEIGGFSQTVEESISVSDLAQCVLDSERGFKKNYSLRAICKELGVPSKKADHHVAGNDANFVLRVLLMLAVRRMEELESDDDQARQLDLLYQLATAQLPPKAPKTSAPKPPIKLVDPTPKPVDTSKPVLNFAKEMFAAREESPAKSKLSKQEMYLLHRAACNARKKEPNGKRIAEVTVEELEAEEQRQVKARKMADWRTKCAAALRLMPKVKGKASTVEVDILKLDPKKLSGRRKFDYLRAACDKRKANLDGRRRLGELTVAAQEHRDIKARTLENSKISARGVAEKCALKLCAAYCECHSVAKVMEGWGKMEIVCSR